MKIPWITSGPAAPAPARRPTAAAVVLLLALTAASYAGALRVGFVADDYFAIVLNRHVSEGGGLLRLFATDYWEGTEDEAGKLETTPSAHRRILDRLYRPVVLLTFALTARLAGLDATWFHLINLVLHAAVAVVLFGLAGRLGLSPGGALAAAALFAVHPLHSEAVIWIVGRAELLAALSVLGVLSWHLRPADAPAGRRYGWLAPAAVFAVGLFSKEHVIVLPALVLVAELARDRGAGPRPGGRPLYAAYAVVVAGYLAARFAALGGRLVTDPRDIALIDNVLAHVDTGPRLLTALTVALRYLGLWLWPRSLSMDYGYNAVPVVTSPLAPAVLAGLLAWGALLGLGAWSWVRGPRRIALAVALTVLAFLPVSNLVVPIGTAMGERLFYLPSAGLCLLAGEAWMRAGRLTAGRLPGRALAAARIALLVLVVTGLAARTVARTGDWADTERLLRRSAPASARVHYQLAFHHQQRGQLEAAVREYQLASVIYPAWPDPLFHLRFGLALLQARRLEPAIDRLERAARLLPNAPTVHYHLGLAYGWRRRFPESERALRRAIALNPGDAASHNALSRLLIEQGRFGEAVQAADEALARHPALVWAWVNRGWARQALGQDAAAAADYEKALTLDPTLAEVRDRLQALRDRRPTPPAPGRRSP